MTVDDNKALAVRFFEALDTGNLGVLQDIFTEDCVFHRGDLIEPARGLEGICSIVDKRVQLYRDFRTTIHQIIGEGDLVATRETHEGIHRGQFPTPIGTFDVTGRPIEWTNCLGERVPLQLRLGETAIFDEACEPVHRRGVTQFSGIYFLGLR
jgi:ketosteroid isomerase-like protein